MKRDPDYVAQCDYCEDPIYEDEEIYVLPGDICIHEDCLFDWAKQYRVIARND